MACALLSPLLHILYTGLTKCSCLYTRHYCLEPFVSCCFLNPGHTPSVHKPPGEKVNTVDCFPKPRRAKSFGRVLFLVSSVTERGSRIPMKCLPSNLHKQLKVDTNPPDLALLLSYLLFFWPFLATSESGNI